MSTPHIILDSLPSLCQNYHIWWKFDVVITKIILLVFFLRHGVETPEFAWRKQSVTEQRHRCRQRIPHTRTGDLKVPIADCVESRSRDLELLGF